MVRLNKLFDKAALLLLGIFLSILLELSIVSAVLGCLTVIVIISLSQCLNNKISFYAIHILFAIMCLFFPGFYLFLPVSIYDIFLNENKYIKFAAVGFPLLCFISSSLTYSISVMALSLTAALLSFRTFQNDRLKMQLIELRDTSEENKILLCERNEYLAKSKDNEISLAIMGERNRIAREIHDSVGHMLSRTILQMGAVRILNKDENIKLHLDEINNSLNGAMTSMRESVHKLHDDSISIRKTIDEIIKPLSEKFTVKLDLDISENTPNEVKLCILGIVREAVSNIIRHSNGNRVIILIREHPAFYQTSIEDNGKNSGKINEGGMGIENMRLRVEKFNGIFKVIVEKNVFKIFTSIPKRKG